MAAIRVVQPDDDVFLISDDGVIIRIPVDQITVQSRYGGGVRAMRLEEGSRVVSIARAPRETEEETEEAQEEISAEETSTQQAAAEETSPAEDAGEDVSENEE